MLFESELLRRLPKYQQDALIDELSAQKLKTHLDISISKSKLIYRIGLYFLGVMFMIASISLLVVNVWDSLSIESRLGLSFLPFAISAIFAFVVLAKDANQFFKELSVVLLLSTFMLFLILISNITNLYSSEADFYFVCILATLPLMYIFKSDVASVALSIFLSIFVWENLDCNYFYQALFIIATTVLVARYILKDAEKIPFFRVLSSYVLFCVTIWIIICGLMSELFIEAGLRLYNFDSIAFFIPIGFGIVLLLCDSLKSYSSRSLSLKPFVIASYVVLAICCFVINNSKGFKNTLNSSYSDLSKFADVLNGSTILIWLMMLSICLAWCILFYKALKNYKSNLPILIGSLMLPLVGLAMITSGDRYFIFMVLSSTIYFATGLSFSLKGIFTKSYINMNVGVIMIISLVVQRALISDVHILVRAGFFAICSVILIGGNFYLNKKLEAKNEK